MVSPVNGMTVSVHGGSSFGLHSSIITDVPDIIKNESWKILNGECWALAGPNGCGKSVLLSDGASRPMYGLSMIIMSGDDISVLMISSLRSSPLDR